MKCMVCVTNMRPYYPLSDGLTMRSGRFTRSFLEILFEDGAVLI